MPATNYRYGGKLRNKFEQFLNGAAIAANATGGDPIIDVSDADTLIVYGRMDFSPSAPGGIGDFNLAILPDVQDGQFWSGAGTLPTSLGAQQRAVSGNTVVSISQFDVRPFSSVKVRYQNVNATLPATVSIWITRATAEVNS